jgi:hypothetical protein
MSAEQLVAIFPRLEMHHLQVTSNPTPEYNCIAWAAGDNTRWWWPVESAGGQQLGGPYWPEGLSRQPTLENFVAAFATLGYEECETAGLEPGYEKVAIYAGPDGRPTHAARQLPDGQWTSKCGRAHDITHVTVEVVGGPPPGGYGEVAQYMRREVA